MNIVYFIKQSGSREDKYSEEKLKNRLILVSVLMLNCNVNGDEDMDYSAFYPSILLMYFGTFAGVITALILLIYGEVYLVKEYLKSKTIIELVGVIACVVGITGVTYFFRNFFKDLPNVINRTI